MEIVRESFDAIGRGDLDALLELYDSDNEIETDSPCSWVITVREGKITRHRVYQTNSEALEAAGLSE